MTDIFVSYSQHDRTVAEELAYDLRRLGMNVWWDAEGNLTDCRSLDMSPQTQRTAGSSMSHAILPKACDGSRLRGALPRPGLCTATSFVCGLLEYIDMGRDRSSRT